MEPEALSSGGQMSPGFSLQEYLAILRRRRAIIIQTAILVSVIGIAQALMAQNVYEGQREAPRGRAFL